MRKFFFFVVFVFVFLYFVGCNRENLDLENEVSNVEVESVCFDEEVSGVNVGYAYVDLGLSVKWATCNVGANSVMEYGDYFAWGETEPKGVYDCQAYKWSVYGKGPWYDKLIKYCNDMAYGGGEYFDYKTILDIEDDAACVNWGGDWRMPTKEEVEELVMNCKCQYVLRKDTCGNSVYGYRVTGVNGNSIFFPTAGFMSGSTLRGSALWGNYWSSSLSLNMPGNACFCFFNSGSMIWSVYDRQCGFTIRPIFPPY
jgi:hypothetical protein